MPDFETFRMSSGLRPRSETGGEIIQNRLQHLVNMLEFQTFRVKRTEGHAELNRLGVCLLATLLSNLS
jgi:hypothetical protein